MPTAINDDGIIIGNDGTQGFVFAKAATSYVAVPGASNTILDAVDRFGDIIGSAYTELLDRRVGFSFSDVQGVLKPMTLKALPLEWLDLIVAANL